MNNDSQSHLPTSGPTGLAAGSVLGTYTLTEPLGRGGMGQVWKATDGKRPVAIKLLPPEFRGNTAAMAQVEDAFQIVHALTHEHICKTLGLFDDLVYGPYLVLDFIPGITLSEYQRTGGFPKKQLPVELVAEILRPVARALDYSHRKVIQLPSGDEHTGVLHRDVKPDNILVVLRQAKTSEVSEDFGSLAPREVWLIDFGLAAEIRNTLTKHTNSSIDTRGTRPYMSPEQIKGKRHQWDARTDQYSLAVVAYQLLSGHLPFDGDDEFSLMLAITQEAADPIPGLPEHVNAAVLKGLAKTKEERFGSCLEFAEALASKLMPRLVHPELDIQLRPGTKAGERTVIDTLGVEIPFRWCPQGKFQMGSPTCEAERDSWENQVHVELTQGFWLGETVVTQVLYRAVLNVDPSHFKGPQRPVEQVSWKEAQAFCQKLTHQLRSEGILAPDWRVCLPTEARWEYACRAGTTTAYFFGNDVARLGQFAWFDGNSNNETHPIGTREANPWGLRDMHGNVKEWCEDWFGNKLVGGTNPLGPSSGWCRVRRGESWRSSDGDCRSAYRARDFSSSRFSDLGFRLCLSSD